MRAAKICLLRRITPRRLVSALFCNWTSARQPMPNMLLSDVVHAAAKDTEQVLTAQQRELLETHIALLSTATSERQRVYSMPERAATLSALRSETLAFSALFRYCAATRLQAPLVAEHYKRLAALQYRLNDEVYDAAWAPFLTQEMCAELRAYVEQGGTNE